MLNIFVHLGHGQGLTNHQERFSHGQVPDPVPYDFHLAEQMGCILTYSVDHPENSATRFARRAIRKILGFDIVHALRNLPAISHNDVVWTMEERQSLAVTFAIRMFCRSAKRPKLIGQSIWLLDEWDHFSRARKSLYAWLLSRVDLLTVHSNDCLLKLRSILPNSSSQVLRFGISSRSFPHSQPRGTLALPIRILAVGRDRSRDWPTVLSAFGNHVEFDVVIITPNVRKKEVEPYRNVRVIRDATMDVLRSHYCWADYVVIAMKRNLYSGITVALQSVRMGVPVVSSRTGGVPTYFNDDQVLYVPFNDPEAMRRAVLDCGPELKLKRASEAQARFERDDYSSHGMVRRYIDLSKDLLKSRSNVPLY
ncbi:MAG TPA: glycosyltransferase [Terriglobales bacterium]|nr:glycosyltransferase [Terriglobales bacterium]